MSYKHREFKNMRDKIQKALFQSLPVILFSLLTITVLIYAWQEPTQPPPSGNVEPPINTSITAQAKEGALIVGNNSAVSTGLIVRYGNVGIGTTNPTQKLDVAGYVKGTGLCIGSDCRTSWPSGGVPTLSQKYEALAHAPCGTLPCVKTINMGTHSFCALVGQEWEVYNPHSLPAPDNWKCLIDYSNGSWSLTAYYYPHYYYQLGEPPPYEYIRCEAMCIDF